MPQLQLKTLSKIKNTLCHKIANLLKDRFVTTILYFNCKFTFTSSSVSVPTKHQKYTKTIKQVYLHGLLGTIHTYMRKGRTVPTRCSLHVKEWSSPHSQQSQCRMDYKEFTDQRSNQVEALYCEPSTLLSSYFLISFLKLMRKKSRKKTNTNSATRSQPSHTQPLPWTRGSICYRSTQASVQFSQTSPEVSGSAESCMQSATHLCTKHNSTHTKKAPVILRNIQIFTTVFFAPYKISYKSLQHGIYKFHPNDAL